ncbi:MAG: RNA polymerase sigma factor (sigma-70 family) [Planctomycetota bacterium]|jgi:RNA polymerase sigma factor (sigma-70 family)
MNDLDADEPDKTYKHGTTEYHVAEARRGGPAAFAMLYERLAPSLETWAKMKVGRTLKDFVEPEDVVQEVWWRAMDSFSRYDPKTSGFRPWLFQIATHVMLEWNRRRRRKARIEPKALAQRLSSLPPVLARQATSVGQNLALKDSIEKLLEVVQRMSEKDQEAFMHCGLEGRKPVEVAVMLGTSEDAIEKRWARLRTKLKTESIWSEFGLVDD